MNNIQPQETTPSPYRGILPFRYVDHSNFYGRKQEVRSLLAKVAIHRLVLLFGESGAGKSSVINAGLIPALEKEGMSAERIRLRPFADKPILIERIPVGENEDEPLFPTIFGDEVNVQEKVITCSLDEFMKRIKNKAEDTYPVLIFDQFEELFTLFGRKSEETAENRDLQNRILNTIFEIVNNQTLKVKVLIGIREDFFGKLEIMSKKYPQVFDNYVRLKHLDESGAEKAILDPFENENPFSSCLTPDLAKTILQLPELSYHDGTTNRIHPTQLQIVCSGLWERYAKTMDEISVQAFEKMGGVSGILEGFLWSELIRVEQSLRPTAIKILRSLITESDTRDIVSIDKLRELSTPQKSRFNYVAFKTLNILLRLRSTIPKEMRGEDVITTVLNTLEQRRVINKTAQRDTYYYELASEYLIKPIQKEKELRIQYAMWNRRRRFNSGVCAGIVFLYFFITERVLGLPSSFPGGWVVYYSITVVTAVGTYFIFNTTLFIVRIFLRSFKGI